MADKSLLAEVMSTEVTSEKTIKNKKRVKKLLSGKTEKDEKKPKTKEQKEDEKKEKKESDKIEQKRNESTDKGLKKEEKPNEKKGNTTEKIQEDGEEQIESKKTMNPSKESKVEEEELLVENKSQKKIKENIEEKKEDVLSKKQRMRRLKKDSSDDEENEEMEKDEKKPRKSDTAKQRLVLSGFEKITRIKKDLSKIFSVRNVIEEADVLVVDAAKRTEKVLDALVRGIPVVSHDFLSESIKNGEPAKIDKFLLKSAFKGLTKSKKERKNLLSGMNIFVGGKPKISTEVLQRWILELGASIKKTYKDADTIVWGDRKKFNLRTKEGQKVVEETWLYDTIEKMEKQNFFIYLINDPELGSEEEKERKVEAMLNNDGEEQEGDKKLEEEGKDKSE
ncbi:glutamic acid-rich protein precursor, putative [Entamoeba invadens IP1]|uniref:Glutamic acid-rich protein, putative n=1 Tax=Entamoeba invadens IP1 TaxID=370355 RepID=L7FM99_ENTIV|nr:glutamic acid-rich protein precursor, putative [Entamoeba invadens IP1]ELP88576.1 glutamic acid-rich protein precursor, putative [Entamoeba invadens IP1]|eukprot:XP_004255347.1 glutamic acid-rich protein precursor, putative [Entamoeba invadens IP1]